MTDNQTPRYRVIEATFIAPHYLPVGSIIETDSDASSALFPLNEAAKAKMEEWYHKEYPDYDKDGQPLLDKEGNRQTVKRNLNKRPAVMADRERAQVTLIQEAPAQSPEGLLSLAEAQMTRPTGDIGTERTKGDKPLVATGDDSTKVLHVPPEPKAPAPVVK